MGMIHLIGEYGRGSDRGRGLRGNRLVRGLSWGLRVVKEQRRREGYSDVGDICDFRR